MLPNPPPAPFSPSQEDLDRLAKSLLDSYREEDARERQIADLRAAKQRTAALLAWDKKYGFRYRFREFSSDPRMDVRTLFLGMAIATVVIPFRLLCLPFQCATLLIRLPFRPAREAPTAETAKTTPTVFPPLRLEVSKIRTFEKLAISVADYKRRLHGGNDIEDERRPERKLWEDEIAQKQLLGHCAQISHRLVDAARYAPLKRTASLQAAVSRRRAHFKERCGATFKHVRVFVSPSLNSLPAKPSQDHEARSTIWARSISQGEGLCPSFFSYEYHDQDSKPHTVRILFDLTRRTLRITRFECQRLERKVLPSPFRDEARDYLPDEEIGSFERTPSEKLWKEFLDDLIKDRIDQCPVNLNEQPARMASWTLDVEFGDYEVHVGDNHTGPIGDKLSLMVGRLIA